MSTLLDHTPTSRAGLQFKGRGYTLTTLQLYETDLQRIDAQIRQRVQSMPNFFAQAPVVIELSSIHPEQLDLDALLQLVRSHQLLPVGLRTDNPQLRQKAHRLQLACLSETKQEQRQSPPERAATNPASSSTKILTQPVRSGQQIYARGGDLVVLSTVSPGAEILSDGCIHVYGTLRGRALAGVQGDAQARIFCRVFEPELVSIAGQYQVHETLKRSSWGCAAVASLSDGSLRVDPL